MRRNLIIGGSLVVVLVVAAVLFFALPRGEFVGSRFSNKYHDLDCTWAKSMARENRIWFSDAADAEAADYLPCSECDPVESD
ncbi:MAG: hypothetical protein PF636_05205 [Actinomycetota bacterium]|jgi:hypothetical protein|nr:hypothetical protein [Actinomycetota bacterium]